MDNQKTIDALKIVLELAWRNLAPRDLHMERTLQRAACLHIEAVLVGLEALKTKNII